MRLSVALTTFVRLTAKWRQGWDRLTIYLPVLLMGLLALGTYWLVRTTPVFGPAEPDKPPSHKPDYFMKQFSVRTFDVDGRLKSEVFGEQVRHFPDTDTLEIDQVRIRTFNSQGRMTTASARHAISNGDGSEVQLYGDAVLIREPLPEAAGQAGQNRFEARGEFLHAFMNSERIKSHKPVQLLRGTDRFSADSLEYDNLDRVLSLQGRVRGVLWPKSRPPSP
jgi:lipopolysaccharide export system protein LptC